ncbi:hypothetical protein ACFC08_05940 [Streptomyces sp. NPDC056112]|uniref:hypothetical protein n=1 Tax=Streptomyces sp. NPDC056112 TaxID=3345715 RepID=UPI0035DE076C
MSVLLERLTLHLSPRVHREDERHAADRQEHQSLGDAIKIDGASESSHEAANAEEKRSLAQQLISQASDESAALQRVPVFSQYHLITRLSSF